MTPLKILSLGAGVQSTTMFLMAEKGDLERPDRAIFADTGWEPPAVYEHLKWLQSVATIPIDVVTAGNIREETIANVREGRFLTLPVFSDDAGKPGMLRRQCTKDYKLLPLQQHARELWAEREREGRAEALASRCNRDVDRHLARRGATHEAFPRQVYRQPLAAHRAPHVAQHVPRVAKSPRLSPPAPFFVRSLPVQVGCGVV